MMKEKCKKGVEIVVESVNFIIITYALSSVSMSLRSSWVYILFFASNVWLITMYCNKNSKKQADHNGFMSSLYYHILCNCILLWIHRWTACQI